MTAFFTLILKNSAELSAAIVAVLLLRRALGARVSPKVWRGVFMLLAFMLAVPLLPKISLPTPLPAPVSQNVGNAIDTGMNILEQTGTESSAGVASAAPETASDTSVAFAAAKDESAPEIAVTASNAEPIASENVSEIYAAPSDNVRNTSHYLTEILIALWLAVALFIFIRRVWGALRFTKAAARRSRKVDRREQLALQTAVKLYGNRRVPELLICPLISTPVLTGVLRPKIFLPERAEQYYTDVELAMLFAHELTHERNGDILSGWLFSFALALNWFNPLVWLTERRFLADAELICDETAVRGLGVDEKKRYGKLILSAAGAVPAGAALSGKGGLKSRLTSLFETRARKIWVTVACVAVVAVLVGVFAFGNDNNGLGYTPIPQTTVDLTPTNELVLDIPGYQYGPKIYKQAVNEFKREYPKVTLTVNTVGDKNDSTGAQYQTALASELMANSGPDVIITDFFPDLYKTMDTGTFLNLNSVIAGDASFNPGDYNTAVMSAGFYKGGQYIMSIGYGVDMFVADQASLDNIGFDLSKANTTAAFYNEISGVLPKMQENPDFQQVIKKIASGSWMMGAAAFLNRNITEQAGIALIDPKTGAVLPDEASFRALCEAYKPYYKIDNAGPFPGVGNPNTYAFYASHTSDVSLLISDGGDVSTAVLFYANGEYSGGSPIFTTVPSNDGGLNALVTNGLAIRAGSPNQLNAWNFIKIMLSQQIQCDGIGGGFFNTLPVNTAALNQDIDSVLKQVCMMDAGVSMAFGDIDPLLTDNERAAYKAAYLAVHESITSCSLYRPQLDQFFNDAMTPYFTGDKTLDACVSDLKGKLMLYASE